MNEKQISPSSGSVLRAKADINSDKQTVCKYQVTQEPNEAYYDYRRIYIDGHDVQTVYMTLKSSKVFRNKHDNQ